MEKSKINRDFNLSITQQIFYVDKYEILYHRNKKQKVTGGKREKVIGAGVKFVAARF